MKTIANSGKLLLFLVLFSSADYCRAQITVSISVTQQPCDSDGIAVANITGGTAPYSVQWYKYGSSPAITGNPGLNLTAGLYYVFVQDSLNHYGMATVTLGIIQFDSSYTLPDTCSLGNGVLNVQIHGGVQPYTYSWSNGTVHTGVFATTDSIHGTSVSYDVQITDANGCYLQIDSLYIPSFSPITTSISTTPSSCNDGTATVTAANGTLPYTYYWSTNPIRTTATIDSLDANSYFMVTVTDAIGCTAVGFASIGIGPNAIQTTASIGNATCPLANGHITISAFGGSPPYSYLWNTGQTSSIITGLSPGNYTIRITDMAGCRVEHLKTVYNTSPVNLSAQTGLATCGNADGWGVIHPSGGTAPYSYLWSNGTAVAYDSTLAAGSYYVVVADVNGCTSSRSIYIQQPSSCYASMDALVWHDINGNCISDVNEFGLPYPRVTVNNGTYTHSVPSNANGHAYDQVLPGNYTLSNIPPPGWSAVCPPSSSVSIVAVAGSTYSSVFYIQPDSLFDNLTCYLSCAAAHPGTLQQVWINYKNNGTSVMNGTLEFHHDPLTQFYGSTVQPSSYSSLTHTAVYNFSNLLPRQSVHIQVSCMVPLTATLGSTVAHDVSIQPVAADVTPADNVDSCAQVVMGSYDPNAKEVSPQGNGPTGLISASDSVLEYTVYFQNTGNFPAHIVRIVDTLDASLDINTLEVLNRSQLNYPMQTSLNGRTVTFQFAPTYLPDSVSNEPGSHGFVSFSIKVLPGTAVGTPIVNTAHIYFDLNPPIATNTVLNTIAAPTGTGMLEGLPAFANVITNPVQASLNVRYACPVPAYVVINLYDLLGNKISGSDEGQRAPGTYQKDIELSGLGLSKGIYMLCVSMNGTVFTEKVIYLGEE